MAMKLYILTLNSSWADQSMNILLTNPEVLGRFLRAAKWSKIARWRERERDTMNTSMIQSLFMNVNHYLLILNTND